MKLRLLYCLQVVVAHEVLSSPEVVSESLNEHFLGHWIGGGGLKPWAP